jgi:hypothetical protein
MRRSSLALVLASLVFNAGIAPIGSNPEAFAAQGDPAAKAEVLAAFQRLNALPSYRMKATNSDVTAVMEVVRPDKMHSTAQTPQGIYEVINVGKETRVRSTMPGMPPGWRCTTGSQEATSRIFNVAEFRKDATPIIRKADTVVDGTPVHTYAEPAGPGMVYIGAQTGLPRRVIDVDKESNKTTTIDFYDYGASISIVLPPCN